MTLHAPLEIPLALSGNFAELRGGHFHAGIDIKTQGRQGLKVRAADKGSIRRIKISTSGYGKTLYVEHNNGLTTVYAHLQKFAPKIEAFIKAYQYEKERYDVQKFLKRGELTVDAQELIGYSGNTGGSFGPHLHFEVRDTDSQRPLNPLRMGLEVADTQFPQLRELHLFDANENRLQAIALKKINDSLYQTRLLEMEGQLGFGLNMFDRQDNSYNRNGIYSVEVLLNGQTQYQYRFDQIDFKDSEYISLFIDHPLFAAKKQRLYKLFTPQESRMSFLENQKGNGFVSIAKGKSYQLKIIVSDFHGNRSYIESYIDGKAMSGRPKEDLSWKDASKILPEKDYVFSFDANSVYVPKKSVFKPTHLRVTSSKDTLTVTTPDIPIRKGFELSFLPPKKDSLEQAQMAIVFLENGKKQFLPTQKKSDQWLTKVKTTGQFTFGRDSIPPTVKASNFKDQQWLSRYRYLKIKIDDSQSGIASYRGTLNGQWILFEYEPKNKTLTYDFRDKRFPEAKHELVLEVSDGVGNTTKRQWTIYRKYGIEKSN